MIPALIELWCWLTQRFCMAHCGGVFQRLITSSNCDGDGREVMCAPLEQHGATVLTAARAPEALDMIRRQHIDVLLVDVAMPGMDGYTFIETLRNSSSSSIARIPAAAVTAHASDEDRARALRAGFQLHIAKPVDSAALVHAVATLSVSRRVDV